MKLPHKLQGFLWFVIVILFLMSMFSVAYFLTGWVYQIIGETPAPLLIQLINSMGGLLLAGSIIGSLSRFFGSRIKAGERRIYGPIIEALERIAKGDFSVSVENFIDRQPPDRGVLKELVNSVNKTALELSQMETMRQEFISNVSHEIQSPLTSIRGFAQALQSNALSPEDRNHYLEIIETESTRLSRITENLIKLASLEAEHVRFEPKPYSLNKQIRKLILACEPQWMEKAIELDASLEEITVTADEDLLSQVWINLIHNSIKFTPSGGRICVELHHEDDGIQFRIQDTGIGISEEDKLHVFERFYKADRSRTRSNNGGSGLGLSIAKKIVDMHKGTIAVDSQPGVGTTFTVSLPGG